MATTIKEKSTGKHFIYFAILSTVKDECTYTLCEFDGKRFNEKERKTTDYSGYQAFLSGYEIVEVAPPQPLCGDAFNDVFWKNYFADLEKRSNAP
jgi:hypothetical protein